MKKIYLGLIGLLVLAIAIAGIGSAYMSGYNRNNQDNGVSDNNSFSCGRFNFDNQTSTCPMLNGNSDAEEHLEMMQIMINGTYSDFLTFQKEHVNVGPRMIVDEASFIAMQNKHNGNFTGTDFGQGRMMNGRNGGCPMRIRG